MKNQIVFVLSYLKMLCFYSRFKANHTSYFSGFSMYNYCFNYIYFTDNGGRFI